MSNENETVLYEIFEKARAGSDKPVGILRGIKAVLATQGTIANDAVLGADEPIAYFHANAFDWGNRQTERTDKFTRTPQPEHGYTLAVYASQPSAQPSAEAMQNNDAAIAAIQFVLRNDVDETLAWLRLWNEGEFDKCRAEWPEAPNDCYIGADPLLATPPTVDQYGVKT